MCYDHEIETAKKYLENKSRVAISICYAICNIQFNSRLVVFKVHKKNVKVFQIVIFLQNIAIAKITGPYHSHNLKELQNPS